MIELQEAIDAINRINRNYQKDSVSRHNVVYFRNRLKDLLEHFSVVKKFHAKALREFKDDTLAKYKEVFESTEETFVSLRDVFEVKIGEYETLESANRPHSPVAQQEQKVLEGNGSIQLQRVDIPKFDGKFQNWRQFREYFESLVHNNAKLTTIEKFHYLINSITGDAGKLLKHLAFAGDNYQSAWQTLIDRYQNNRALVNSYIKLFMSQPQMEPNAKSIERFYNTTVETVASLESMTVPVGKWDALVVYIIESKMDTETRAQWEQELKGSNEVPTFKQVKDFLQQRLHILEAVQSGKVRTSRCEIKVANVVNNPSKSANVQCYMCKFNHNLHQCAEFLKLSVSRRRSKVKDLGLCFNCLRSGHISSTCTSKYKCRECSQSHHSLLHDSLHKRVDRTTTSENTRAEGSTSNRLRATNVTGISGNACHTISTTLLPTAKVIVESKCRNIVARALVDQGSQVNIISRRLANRLNLKIKPNTTSVEGIGLTSTMSLGEVNVTVRSRINENVSLAIQAMVMETVIKELPTMQVKQGRYKLFEKLELADPEYSLPSRIEILIGADVLAQILLPGLIRANEQVPMAQQTSFGWILSGPVEADRPPMQVSTIRSTASTIESNTLNEILRKFWEIEEIEAPHQHLSSEEKECEEEYANSYRRDETGRFIVRIPLKMNPSVLGSSKDHAMMRFHSLERRLNKNLPHKKEYSDIVKEYLKEAHMELVPNNELEKAVTFYMPHHAVIKESSTTTKVRVVFDASAKASSGISLNEIMKVGPVLQQDLYALLMAWRTHKYVFTADIKGMYRQIWLQSDQWDLQRILWRHSHDEPVRTYRLKTVTFGTAAAPYLATKTIQQLGLNEAYRYPLGSELLRNNFYVDDLLGGADDIPTCIQYRNEVIALLKEAGFNIRQWLANQSQITENLPLDLKETKFEKWLSSETKEVRTLGIHWDPKGDTFTFKSFEPENYQVMTKRQLASEAGRIFDPLGWLAPIIIGAKIILQNLWLQQIGWDEEVPTNVGKEWITFREEISHCQNITIPRWVNTTKGSKDLQIHAFCDSSEAAYAACIYISTLHGAARMITLLTAKTKVAPMKKISLPRLELCGATLLSRLVKKLHEVIPSYMYDVHAWTDSTIVLDWLRQPPHKWKTYVANRVSEIHNNNLIKRWHYVPTKSNPADLATRGTTLRHLKDNRLWWQGPDWLTGEQLSWPQLKGSSGTTLEAKAQVSVCKAVAFEEKLLLNRYSSLEKLLKITAWCMRWKNRQNSNHISVKELQSALYVWIKLIQHRYFASEISAIKDRRSISSKSSILSLTPWLDDDGILRMGSRLRHLNLDHDQKYNIILPGNNTLTGLIIRQAHEETFHGGTQMTLQQVRNKYWIVKGRQQVKQHIHHCMICARFKVEGSSQLMGELPKERVTTSKPFQCTGIDYAGPLSMRRNKGRSAGCIKGYIALFICFATKAVHLEIVTDLSSDALIAAIRRFVSRRGPCYDIYSDNGTNMIGAARQLKEFKGRVHQQHKNIASTAVGEGINWHFIPPRAPHFGGLWESAVKSVKHHLKRTLGNNAVTIEEMMTILCQIENCLNSRPLCKLTDDPEDYEVLTPNHFLIGRQSVHVVDGSPFTKSDLTRRWNFLQDRVHHFWEKWTKEYLHTLASRNKWKVQRENLKIGQLVLLKDDQLPPLKWDKGIIENVIAGEDGMVRVVQIKTQHGVLKRPINKVCVLPVDLNENSNNNSPVNSLRSNTTNGNLVGVTSSSHKVTGSGPIQWWYMMLCVLSVMGVAQASQTESPYNVAQFRPNTGIFYERVASMRIKDGDWKLIAYYNISTLIDSIRQLETSVAALKETCAMQKSDNFCGPIWSYATMSVQELHDKLDVIQNHHGQLNRRIKRGFFNGVGSLANALFGVLDDDFAKQYHAEISRINENQELTMSVIRNMTSVINLSAKELEGQDRRMAEFASKVSEQLRRKETQANMIKSEVESFIHLFSLTQSILFHLWESHRTQDLILNSVVDAQHGIVSSQLLPVRLLQQQLAIIHHNLGFGRQVLFEDKMDWIDLYKTIRIRTAIHLTLVIFELSIPIVEGESFEVFKMHALPTRINNTYFHIEPSDRYLILNQRHDRYFTFNEVDYAKCMSSEDQLLCETRSPIYNLGSSEHSCELNTFLHQVVDTSSCRLTEYEWRPTWIQLTTQNSWLFMLESQHHLEIYCSSTATSYSLTIIGEGILHAKPGCTIKHASFIINIRDSVTSRVYREQFASPQWKLNTTARGNQEVKVNLSPTTLWKRANMSNIHRAISELKESQQQLKMHSSIYKEQGNMVITMVIIIVVICIIVITIIQFLCHQNRCKRRNRLTPIRAPNNDELTVNN